MDLTSAAIATLISSGVASAVTYFLNRSQRLRTLNDQLDNILKISIQYPYLENPKFTSTWLAHKDSDDEPYLRYENYCTLVFNFMERLSKHHRFNAKKLERHLNLKGWIRIHKDCWENPSLPFENADGYCAEFKSLIDKYLK
jgi:hypothetical protein